MLPVDVCWTVFTSQAVSAELAEERLKGEAGCCLRLFVGPRACRRRIGLSWTRCADPMLLFGLSWRLFALNSLSLVAVLARALLGRRRAPCGFFRACPRTTVVFEPVAVRARQDSPSVEVPEETVCCGAIGVRALQEF